MKNGYVFLIALMISSTIYAQEINTYDVKKFDIQEFNKKKDPLNKMYRYTRYDGATVRQIERDNTINEYIEDDPKNPTFQHIRIYYKNTLFPKISSTRLYTFVIGIARYYNEDGSLKEEVDYDALYGYSWQELVTKIKDEYGVDMLTRGEGKFLGRQTHPYPYYKVWFYDNNGVYQQMVFSGINGVLLYRSNEKGETETVNDPPEPQDKEGKR